MRVEVKWDRERRIVEVADGSVVEDLLLSLRLSPDAFIATRKGVPIPLTEFLREQDSLRLIRVASGG